MLDKFIDEQKLFCEEIDNCIKNNKLSHAFLIETRGYEKKNELIISFIKEIFRNTDSDNFENISNLIDNDALADLMIVEADGSIIKKDQVLDIQERFKTMSYEDRPRIYWIKDADKLNKYAFNSLLKFLEEPLGNVIGILDTTNRYMVSETIRSRCQIYSLVNNKKDIDIEDIEIITKIVECLEEHNEKSIAYLSSVLDNDLRDKEFWINTFKVMIDIYDNAIRKIEGISSIDYGEIIEVIKKNDDVKKIVNKLDVLFTTLSNLDYNLNISMMLDKFIIEFAGGD